MVRVGGGWDTLQHYLDKHDPCRCTSLCECPRPRAPRPCQPPVGGERGGSSLLMGCLLLLLGGLLLLLGVLAAAPGGFQEQEAP